MDFFSPHTMFSCITGKGYEEKTNQSNNRYIGKYFNNPRIWGIKHSFLLYICTIICILSYVHIHWPRCFYIISFLVDKRTKQNAFQEKIVQSNRFSLAIHDKIEGHPCPIGTYYNEATGECKCSDISTYRADNAQCKCNEGYKEITLFKSYIRCYKYTDARGKLFVRYFSILVAGHIDIVSKCLQKKAK